MKNKHEIGTIIKNRLSNLIDNPVSELEFSNEFELLVAVMLSAQCTDKRVNQVTDVLFKDYSTVEQFANIDAKVLEKNFYYDGEIYKRFFIEEDFKELFKDFEIISLEEKHMDRYEKPKTLWEFCIKK